MPAQSLLYSFLALTAHMFLPRYSARLQILLFQIKTLKSSRIVATPEEKAELLHLGTRRVYCSPATRNPDNAWVVQQACNASMWLAGEGERAEMLIHDADTKFSAESKRVWAGEGVECKQIAHRAPMQNSFAENFIGTIKRECLNHFLGFSRDQLDYINRAWVRHYHMARPHQGLGIGNRVLDEQFKPQHDGPVKCREKLGGLIREYYREAA